MKTKPVARRNKQPTMIRPRVKLWFELAGDRAFCPGVCGILQQVDETGSIKDAAAAIGRSYRFVWGKIKQVEQALGCPLVETRVGGSQEQRGVLTDVGRTLLVEFVTLRQQLFDIVDRDFAPRLQAAVARARQPG